MKEEGGAVRGQSKVSEREQGKGLFEGLVDTQEELYCPNIPQISTLKISAENNSDLPFIQTN